MNYYLKIEFDAIIISTQSNGISIGLDWLMMLNSDVLEHGLKSD